MLLEEMMRDERMEGMQEGLKKGMQQGQERINQLIILLSKQNRSEDIIKAASDKEYQEKLLKEFNLYSASKLELIKNKSYKRV